MAKTNTNPDENAKAKVTEAPAQEEIQQEIMQLTDHIQRLQAEFENYRKRTDDEKKGSKTIFTAEILRKIVPIIDHFETALQHPCTDKNYEEGMKLIHWLFFNMLEKEEVKMLNPLNQKYDQKLHEAVETENDEQKESNIITKVIQRGYTYKDLVLQRARVVVNKRTNDSTNSQAC